MLLGIDLDNTIIDYDDAFVSLAREMGLVQPDFAGGKNAVREAARGGESGDVGWQKLQARAYGSDIGRARLAEGVRDLLERARARNVAVVVVSHKTEFSPYGPRTNLRAAALRWMSANGLFETGKTGLRPESVFFEGTRADKIERIKTLGCTHFIDDLPEVFNEPSFPTGVHSYLYAAGYDTVPEGRFRAFPGHRQIADHLFGAEPWAAAAMLSGKQVSSVTPVLNGRNNRLYRVATPSGNFALKCYPAPDDDARDRLGTEFGALLFLKEQGEAAVPTALARMPGAHVALYEWVEGGPVLSPSTEDLDQVIAFTRRLYGFRHAAAARRLPLASEACLSGQELIDQVGRRQQRLHEAAQTDTELDDFLNRLRATYDRLAASVEDRFRRELTPDCHTLSPSDFGFHNALKRADGRVVFLDFEYFGWDDPVKLAADVMLHPGMNLDEVQRQYLAKGMLAVFGADREYEARLARLLPLYALRWCLIMLNEFLPERWARRAVAGEQNQANVKVKQLAKANDMLRTAVALEGSGL